ncbi:MAG: hypothetical protein KJ592_04170, partial [Nanoarchaeota archaeon]|nr:hypothetical protein [Nanoarchaeota archaeon]
MGFLFWLFFVGIVVAGLQDLKRREVDNWLNLFLLVASFVFVFYRAIFEGDAGLVRHIDKDFHGVFDSVIDIFQQRHK